MSVATFADVDINYYATTEGCYVITDNLGNKTVAFHCNSEDPWKIDVNGEDLFIVWYEGDISALIHLADGVRNIVFERNDGGKFKVYPFERFKKITYRSSKYS